MRDRLLLKQACLVRNCGNKIGCTNHYFRIAARPKEEVDYLVAAIKQELKQLTGTTTPNKQVIRLNNFLSYQKAS
ncbi:MAG: hypothetical protein M3142_12390 [Bacteroidota bacterium]|nr:hypothetical protein [Bacteroidota bacterium]